MSKTFSNFIKLMLAAVVVAGGVILISSSVHGQRMQAEGYSLEPAGSTVDWEIVEEANAPDSANLPPNPEQDECLHCHISGKAENLWVPLTRWVTFGTVGIVMAFGLTRSAWVWKNRKPWEPISTRVGNWVDERYQTKKALEKALNKPVPNWATRWWYCLGGITAFLFVIQAATGIMLAFYYKPTPEAAYESIVYIENEVLFGASIRAIHHWAANGMIVMCVAHMLRVFIMGAFKAPRELNWTSGVLLLIMTLGFGFTGYLLPWDQRAYWASTVGSAIAGDVPDIGTLILVFLRVGWNITAETLNRFFALHVLVLPLAVVIFMGLHFMMIRRQGLKEPL